VCFRLQIATESERCFFGSRFSVALLHNLPDFATEIHFGREKPEHAKAPPVTFLSLQTHDGCTQAVVAILGGMHTYSGCNSADLNFAASDIVNNNTETGMDLRVVSKKFLDPGNDATECCSELKCPGNQACGDSSNMTLLKGVMSWPKVFSLVFRF